MPADLGYAYFPGIQQIISGQLTLGHGITPNVATLTIAPQSQLVQTQGTLTFVFGSTVIEFPDCLVNAASYTRDSNGLIYQLQIYDRRWRWGYGKISGMYNVRRIDGQLVGGSNGRGASLADNTEKSPQDLARLCFAAIGETNFDVSALPNAARPFVEWDVAQPMQALADLCELLGCRIVLGIDNKVRICRRGQGDELPYDLSVMDESATFDPPDEIQKYTVVTGRCLFQTDFALEPVGIEPDGTIKPLDDLSYTPAGGWGDIDLKSFNGVGDTKLRELAESCVFKTYRVVVPVKIPGYGTVDSLELLDLTNEQVLTSADYSSTGRLLPDRQKEALVFGDYYQKQGTYTNTGTTTLPDQPTKEQMKYVITGFNLDANRGLVTFSEPIFKLSGSGNQAVPAVLKLRTATYLRQAADRAAVRWEQFRGQSTGKPEKVRQVDEIVLAYKNGVSNKAEVDKQINYYLDAMQQELQVQQPYSITYAGLKRINLDGAIQQVSFEVGPSGCRTKASRSTDQDMRVPSYEERRFYEKLRGIKPAKPDTIKKRELR